MAKQTGLFKFQGTIGEITSVCSSAYGEHTRKRRGTKKKVRINEVFQKNANKTKGVNGFGSPILKLFKTLDRGFADGRLWSRMTGSLLGAKGMKVEDLLDAFNGFEINERYLFGSLFTHSPEFTFSKRRGSLFVEAELFSPPYFQRDVKADSYLGEVHVLFYFGKDRWNKQVQTTDWISVVKEPEKYKLKFTVPKGAKYFMAVAGLKGGIGEVAVESFFARGYFVCGWGKC